MQGVLLPEMLFPVELIAGLFLILQDFVQIFPLNQVEHDHPI